MQDLTPSIPWLLALLLTTACGSGSPARPSCTGLDVTGPASVRGRVVYQGAGVQGRPVSIAGRETTTGADGTFSLDAITPGRQPVAVGSGAFDSAAGEATLVRGENHLLIPIVRALNEGVVAGRTLDGCTGRPLAGVTVTVGSRTTTTDVNGQFVLEGLCCGTLPRLDASREGYSSTGEVLGRLYNSSRYIDLILQPLR